MEQDRDARRELIKEAQSPTATPERLAELAQNQDVAVRRAVARHGTTPKATVESLLADPSWEVRTVAAHNKHAPAAKAAEVIQLLVSSMDPAQRRVIARSPKVPVEALIKLADDPDVETRANAVRNANTPPNVARAKLTDSEPSVVLGALAHPSISNDERRAFVNEELLTRFFEQHSDGDHLFEALCERFLWDVLERAFHDPEKFDDVWKELVSRHFELVEIPSRNTVLVAVHRDHWKAIITRLADEVRGKPRLPD